MEDLAVFTALNHDSGSLGKNFVKLKKKVNMLFTGVTIGFRAQTGKLYLRGRNNNNWGK